MLAKLGFLLLVLMFGSAMFCAGAQAPEAVRAPLSRSLTRAASALRERLGALEGWLGEPGEPAARPMLSARYSDLLLTAPGAPASQYALQVGLFVERASAADASAELGKLGYSAPIIALGQSTAPDAYLLAVGPFSTLADAQAARARLLQSGLTDAALLPIRFPEPAAAPPPAPAAAAPAAAATRAAASG